MKQAKPFSYRQPGSTAVRASDNGHYFAALCVTASTAARNSPDNFGHAATIFVRLGSSCARHCASAVLAVSEAIAAAHASRKRSTGSIPARAAMKANDLSVVGLLH
jgi:hypothetical protein